ncbi:MAG: putative lipid II flippase FtsW [Patescibacteria group bacterium]|jgi:cell division protein FtsW|nr:putative lipid II flippase FtsW [Patescibacteria group bacterium]
MAFKRLFKRIDKNDKEAHQPDKSLIFALFAILILGMVMLFSASSVVSYTKFGNTFHYVLSQSFGLLVGLGLFFISSRIKYDWWKKVAGLMLFVSIILLTLVFIPGLASDYGTARSWINIFGLSFQPSELVKISFLIYLSTWMEAKKGFLNSFTGGVLPFLIILGVISALMLAQPDLGTLFIIGFSAMIVFFVAGGSMKHIVMGLLSCILIFYLAFGGVDDYQDSRFLCYTNPENAPQGECYHINQSLIAVGSGGLLGRGLGQSRQKFLYLPEVWGDAIFPVIAEELGFIFTTLFILLYLYLFYRGLLIAKNSPDVFSGAIAVGIVAWLSVQTFLNIGGMIKLIPMTGVPLPFVSAGGSSLMSSLLAMGILINISKYTKKYDR